MMCEIGGAVFTALEGLGAVLFCGACLWMLCCAHLSTGPLSHEQKLSQSLEIALASTLGSMPSFTARLTRGQLQHLGTRGSNTSWRPGTGSGNMGPAISLEPWNGWSVFCLWMLGRVPGGSVTCLASLPVSSNTHPGREPVLLPFPGVVEGLPMNLNSSQERLSLVNP